MSPSPLGDGFGTADRARLRRGTILSVFGGVVLAGARAAGFFLRPIFGGEMWGLYAIAWALTELLAFLLLGGFNDAVVIFSSRLLEGSRGTGKPDEEGHAHYQAMGTLIRAPLLAAIAIAAVIHLGAPQMHSLLWSGHDPIIVDLVRTLSWTLPLLVLVQVPVEATRSSLRFGFAVGIVQIAVPLLSLFCALGLYFTTTPSILAVAEGGVLALALCVPASFYAYSRHFDLARTVRSSLTAPWNREALSFALPQSLNMALNQGLVRLDSLMLSFFGISANLIGIYSLVGDLTQVIRLAKMAFSGVYSPLVAKYRAAQNHSGIQEALELFVRKTSSLGLLLLLVVMSLWPLLLFQGGEVWEGSRAFPWLLCAGPMMSCFFGLCGNTLLMCGRSRLLLINALCAGALNLLLNALFIPWWGLFGAALATAISNTTISCLQIIELRRFERLGVKWSYYRRTILAVLPSLAMVFFATTSGWVSQGGARGASFSTERMALAAASVGLYAILLFLLPGSRPFGRAKPEVGTEDG